MATINYESSAVVQRNSTRWIVATITGAAMGLAIAMIAYDPAFRVIANGRQFAVFVTDEPIWARIRFTLAIIVGGMLIGASVVSASKTASVYSIIFWAFVFCGVYFAAATLGLLYARNQVSQIVGTLPLLAPIAGSSAMVPFSSAPTLLAPIVGSVAVLMTSCVVILRNSKSPTRSRGVLSALQIVIAIAMFPAFFCMVSFLAAKTPMQAATDGRPLPPGWAAGVWSHGNYYHWWPINERPGLFALSVLTSVLCIAFLLWSVRRRRSE